MVGRLCVGSDSILGGKCFSYARNAIYGNMEMIISAS